MLPSASIQHSPEELRQIIELLSLLGSADFNVPTFMNLVTERMMVLTTAAGAVVELRDGDEMVYHAPQGSVARHAGVRIKVKGSLSGLCVEKGEALYSEDTSNDPRVNAEACRLVNAASMVVMPLYRLGKCVGVLKVLSGTPRAFTEHHIQTLQLMAGLLGGALGQQLEVEGRREAEEQHQHMAMHDALTGLPNRKLFHDRLAHALVRGSRGKTLLAVMYLDLDGFKTINDTHGHEAGDEALKFFTERVRQSIRASDTLARLGGDEFALITEDLKNPGDTVLIAAKILDAMQTPFMFHGSALTISASIGIAVSTGENMDGEKLLSDADKAMYEAKKAGKNCFRMGSA